MIYLDTSAAVPLFVREPASAAVDAWFETCSDPLLSSDWIVTEFASALSLKERLELENWYRSSEDYLAWAREHPASYRQLFMTRLDVADPDAPDPREPGALPDFSSVPGLSALVADLERARAAGHPVGDPSLAAFALWGLVHGFASLSVTEPDIPFEFLVAGLHRASAGLLLRDE